MTTGRQTAKTNGVRMLVMLAATILAAAIPAVALAAPGSVQWTRQFGTMNQDIAQGVATYGPEVYVVGLTWGAFSGNDNQGQNDVFVRRYDNDGNFVWHRQTGSSNADQARAAAVNQGGHDAFVRKYEPGGADDWTRQFGSSAEDFAVGIAADSSGVYVGGQTKGALEGRNAGDSDAFVRRYSLGGSPGWTDQYGTTAFDAAYGVGLDAPRGLQEPDPPLVYVVGSTAGTLPGESGQGNSDAYARAYKKVGPPSNWTAQFGTTKPDTSTAVAGVGSVAYIAGRTDGAFPGQTSKGLTDAFLRKYD